MTTSSNKLFSTLSSVGIDIGKDVFHIVGFDTEGRIALRRKIRRLSLAKEFEKLPRCIVGMEACLSAHFVSRTLRGLGFEPRIVPAKHTRPFNKGQKNDYNDAEAIAEAVLRPNLKLVQEKTQDQLDLQALHRVRSRLISRRTATIKPSLGGISRRGNEYLRTLFIQAANVILMHPHNWEKFSFGPWLTAASTRMHRNKLAAALANKLARISWSVLRNDKAFDRHNAEVTAI